MRKNQLKRYNRLIAFLMSLLGVGGGFTITGCEKVSPCEYGTPHATYKLNGKVTNENNEGINNIRVTMYYDTAFTDESGNYNLESINYPPGQEVILTFTDVDGNNNGSFQESDTTVSFEGAEYENGDGSWYLGETSKEVNIKLKEEI